MGTLETQTLICPCCGTRFETQVLTGPNKFDGQTSEFRRTAVGLDPLPYLLAICPTCGFAELIGVFATAVVADDVRQMIDAELRPLMAGGVPPTSTRYALAARIAGWQHKGDVVIGNLFMRAAWSADDEGTDSTEYRRAAIERFVAAVDGPTPPENALTLIYLVGELYRRLGESEAARPWFDRALAEASASSEPAAQRIVALAQRQRDEPNDRI